MLAFVVVLLTLCSKSFQQLSGQSDLWNATFTLTDAQIKAASISQETARSVEVALRYERTNNAGGPTQDDPFYNLPASYDTSNPPPPGTVLKVEEYTNLTLYSVPMSLSMSRFLYMTETFNGTSQPASAYVLWPYLPRKFEGLTSCSDNESGNEPVFPVIAFAHGTSGQNAACAPSGLRNLWDEFHEPFPMALAGYAVVATDYLGLGIKNISSPYFVLPSQANDVYHAVAAAQKAWPQSLSKQFVVAGQSQGGGVAWSAAQRQAQRSVDGYLGTVAMSPFTDILAIIAADNLAEDNARVSGIAQGLASVYPGFEESEWLTDAGIARLRLLQEIQGCNLPGAVLGDAEDLTVQILKDGWNLTESAQWYNKMSSNGGKPFEGPMLVLQGTEDPNANEPVNTPSVKQTCKMYPESQLEYYRWETITHVPVLYAGQHMWLDWIYDRFAGVEAPPGCSIQTLKSSRGMASTEFAGWEDQTWFLEYDKEAQVRSRTYNAVVNARSLSMIRFVTISEVEHYVLAHHRSTNID